MPDGGASSSAGEMPARRSKAATSSPRAPRTLHDLRDLQDGNGVLGRGRGRGGCLA
jgi:hypothetical protein